MSIVERSLAEYRALDPSNRRLFVEMVVAEGRFASMHDFYEAMIDAALSE